MPEINKIPEVLYDGNQPYHVHYDNLPLKNILARIDLVNAQVDINSDILRGSSGTVGSLNNRLSVSIENNGELKSGAVDNALHNIGAHQDGSYNGIDYVRMTQDERDKLNLIESEANNLRIEIEDTIPNLSGISVTSAPYSLRYAPDIIPFNSGVLRFRSSDTIFFDFEAPDVLKAHSVFPPQAAHVHSYNIIPAHYNPSNPDYQNYKTTSIGTPFAEESLRVYINGMRIPYYIPISIPQQNNLAISNWSDIYVDTMSPSNGEFSLNRAILPSDVIVIDFDQDL